MSTIGKIARRTFLFGAAAIAGGVAFGYYRYSKPFPNPLEDELAEGEATFNPYVKIGNDGKITVIAPRAEMGQGSYTTLAALVCEELDVRLDQVSIEHGPASPAYYNSAALSEGAPVPQFDEGMVAESLRAAMKVVAKFVALQFTGGSTSATDSFEKMRYAGAGAREALKQAAALKLGVTASTLRTSDGIVTDPASGRSLSYGELARDAAAIEPPSDIVLRDHSEWKILGKSQPRKDMRAKVTGAPIFGIDTSLPDMLYGTVRMNPSPSGRMRSFDAAAALAMPGVKKVVAIDSPYGQGIGVIADNTWHAFKAAEAVSVEWEQGPAPASSAEIDAVLTKTLDGPDFFTLRTIGDPERIFADAPRDKVTRGAIRRAVPVACDDGANERDGATEGRRARSLGTEPGTYADRGDRQPHHRIAGRHDQRSTRPSSVAASAAVSSPTFPTTPSGLPARRMAVRLRSPGRARKT